MSSEVVNEQEFLEIGGVRLRCSVAGHEDGSLVVLIHGFPACAATWKAQIPALAAARYRVVADDLG